MMQQAQNFDRYHRQMLLSGWGKEGQRRLARSHALLVGCGALGCVIADALTRAGVGRLTIVDRDVVEITNLQRQVLFTEADVAAQLPKALAAKARLASVNSQVSIEAHVDDFNHRNAEQLLADADVILDGLDNFETRYVLNDAAVKHHRAYVYGGAVGTTGMSLTILPHPLACLSRLADATAQWSDSESTGCLRCVFPDAPPPGTTPTCDTAGVLGPVVNVIASHQASQAIKLLIGANDAVDRSMLTIDLWRNEWRRFDVSGAREAGNCPCCKRGRFEFLEGSATSIATSLCGRNAVQITPPSRAGGGHGPNANWVDLQELAQRLAAHGRFTRSEHVLRGQLAAEVGSGGEPIELMVFPNGRTIIKGTSEPETARSIYARYIGA
jgi:adenylyltransferase/sulfurtransferase